MTEKGEGKEEEKGMGKEESEMGKKRRTFCVIVL